MWVACLCCLLVYVGGSIITTTIGKGWPWEYWVGFLMAVGGGAPLIIAASRDEDEP